MWLFALVPAGRIWAELTDPLLGLLPMELPLHSSILAGRKRTQQLQKLSVEDGTVSTSGSPVCMKEVTLFPSVPAQYCDMSMKKTSIVFGPLDALKSICYCI